MTQTYQRLYERRGKRVRYAPRLLMFAGALGVFALGWKQLAPDIAMAAPTGPAQRPPATVSEPLTLLAGYEGAERLTGGARAGERFEADVTLSRTFDGASGYAPAGEPHLEITVAQGAMDESLFAAAVEAGADRRITQELAQLFGHRLDFSRDIEAGDAYRLVFERQVSGDGATMATGRLLYAEIEGSAGRTRFYRFERAGRPEYFDENGRNIRGLFMRTPVDGARVTSSFGMRRHPILGYDRMHQGIDFAAGSGTPILAAGDGVVVEARAWGGYGNWLRIRHADGWETGYAHLSGYAPGLQPGRTVRQGEVVAYVGSTGASTGPHLHYEIWRHGERVDPSSARVPQGLALSGDELWAFRRQRARIDAMLEGGPGSEERLSADVAPSAAEARLRGQA